MDKNVIGCEFGKTDPLEATVIANEEDYVKLAEGLDEDFSTDVDVELVGIDEHAMQEHIISVLVNKNGFIRRFEKEKHFDNISGIDFEILKHFIKESQPNVIEYFEKRYESKADENIRHLIISSIRKQGSLAVLKNGISPGKDYQGPDIKLSYPKPISNKNPKSQENYTKNIFTVMSECKYDNNPIINNRLDLVIFLNGIPIITSELKTEMKGQNVLDAEKQYKDTRDPNAIMLRNFSGAIVHFAISRRRASFTTRLNGKDTVFFPFNKGRNNGAGNPDVSDILESKNIRTYYIWHSVWTKDSLLDLIYNFIYTSIPKDGKTSDAFTVFPRYHQLKLNNNIRDVLESNPVDKRQSEFLIQNSAGSGKTYSITWLAYGLARVQDGENPMYDTIIVQTDRRAVIKQLQQAIRDLAPKQAKDMLGIVDKNTAQLMSFIKEGRRIIVTTVQKFSYLQKDIETISKLKGKRFAIIIDEVQSGQSGENSMSMVDLLSDNSATENIKNIDFFAFTATPRKETLKRFGNNGKPFDLYSMKQAIEEGFILDVLKNYISHTLLNHLSNGGEDNTLTSNAYATRALNNMVRTSEENMDYKATTVLNHMIDYSLKNVNIDNVSMGKGMVVTGGRKDVSVWLDTIEKLKIKNPKFLAIKPIVAFTGNIEYRGKQYTEEELNRLLFGEHYKESMLPSCMSGTEANLLIVADKYQTGYDNPLLTAMYLDKKVSGISAVQTLSRLNRFHPQKNDVVVIDFQDNATEVEKAFREYNVESNIRTSFKFEDIEISARRIYAYKLFTAIDVNKYYEASLKEFTGDDKEKAEAAQTLGAIFDKILDNIEDYMMDDNGTTTDFKNFMYEASSFRKDYKFLSQFQKIKNTNLKGLYVLLKSILNQNPSSARTTDGDSQQYREQLKSILIALTSSAVDEIEFDIDPEKAKGFKDSTRMGTNGLNLTDYDKPVTIEELVERWNSRLLELMKHFKSEGKLVNLDHSDKDYMNILASIVEVAVSQERFNKYAKEYNSQLFDSETTREWINGLILQELATLVINNESISIVAREMINNYSNSEDYKFSLQEAILQIVYQSIINKELEA